jgi:hypothetical protein
METYNALCETIKYVAKNSPNVVKLKDLEDEAEE